MGLVDGGAVGGPGRLTFPLGREEHQGGSWDGQKQLWIMWGHARVSVGPAMGQDLPGIERDHPRILGLAMGQGPIGAA